MKYKVKRKKGEQGCFEIILLFVIIVVVLGPLVFTAFLAKKATDPKTHAELVKIRRAHACAEDSNCRYSAQEDKCYKLVFLKGKSKAPVSIERPCPAAKTQTRKEEKQWEEK